jgi:hypothetical protein
VPGHLSCDHLSGSLWNHLNSFLGDHPWHLDCYHLGGLLWDLDGGRLRNHPLYLLLDGLHVLFWYHCYHLLFIGVVHSPWHLPGDLGPLLPHGCARHHLLNCLVGWPHHSLCLLGHECPRLHCCLRFHVLYHGRLGLWYHGCPRNCLHLSLHDGRCDLLPLHLRLWHCSLRSSVCLHWGSV